MRNNVFFLFQIISSQLGRKRFGNLLILVGVYARGICVEYSNGQQSSDPQVTFRNEITD